MTGIHTVLMRKVRGVRVVNLAGGTFLVLMVLSVYASKAGAGAEGARIADTTRQIAAEQQQVQLLRAERAYLTRPDNLRRLSTQFLNMGPVAPSHEVTPEALLQVHEAARTPAPAPVPAPSQTAAPTPAAEAPPVVTR